jgi:hypothetical protein
VSACALWQGTQRLVAVIVDDDGGLRPPITVPATPNNAHHLLTYLATAGVQTVILAEASHNLIAQAHALNLPVRLVPGDLLDAIRAAVGLDHRPPRHTAMLLARWYLIPALRRHLRVARPPAPRKNQLDLL